jgi:peptidoglycan/xylan/chitin deacetylase (PgdA/CDA1 family)
VKAWPDGRRLAVYVAVGCEEYRPDGGLVEDLLPGVPAPDRVNAAWRDYGNRVGAFRLFEALGDAGITPTVLLNTIVYDTAPAVTDAARAAGAEIVGHGISNSDTLAGMEEPAELDYVEAVAQRILKEEGVRPGGWSSPWLAHTPTTIGSLVETGYRYLLDLRADDRPEWLDSPAGPLLSIPYALELNDSTSVIGRHVSPSDFADMVVDEFDELLDAAVGGEGPLVLSVITHSFISGVPFRLHHLRRALHHIAAHDEVVWRTQPRHIYAAWAARHPAPER